MTTEHQEKDCLHCVLGEALTTFYAAHPDYSSDEAITDVLEILVSIIVGFYKETGDANTLAQITLDLRERIHFYRQELNQKDVIYRERPSQLDG